MRNVTITIDETGAIEIEANGFKGKGCEQKVKAFIDSLGAPTSQKKKPEYYDEEKPHIQN